MTYQKVGNFVTLHIPAFQGTTGTGSTAFVSNTALPAAIRPSAATQQFPVTGVVNNGASVDASGIITLTTAGILTLNRDGTASAFTDAQTAGTSAGITLTYFVG